MSKNLEVYYVDQLWAVENKKINVVKWWAILPYLLIEVWGKNKPMGGTKNNDTTPPRFFGISI